MASRRTRRSVSPARLERTPSSELELAPLTEKTRLTEKPHVDAHPKEVTRTEKKGRNHRNLSSNAQSRQPPSVARPLEPNNAPEPSEPPAKAVKIEQNLARSVRRRRARLLSELDAAEDRNNSGMSRIPAHTLVDLLFPLGNTLSTLPWSMIPTDAASVYFHLVPIQINHRQGCSTAIWMPEAPVNLVPSYMLRVDNLLDEDLLETWRLDSNTTVRIAGEVEVHLRMGNSQGLTLAKECCDIQCPVLGQPASAVLGIMMCPIRQRITNTLGDAIQSVRCLRK